MEIAQAIAAVLVVATVLVAIAVLQGRRKHASEGSSEAGQGDNRKNAASRQQAALELTAQELSYRVCDPHAPGRELLVQFVPSDLAQLAEVADASQVSDSHGGANAFDALVDSVPKAAALIESGMTMRVVGPPDALAGLSSGAFELVTTGGKSLGQVRELATGHFGSHLQIAQAGVTPAMGALAVFQVMSVVTGQYYLHRIDAKLGQVQEGISGLVRGQQSELRGKVEAAARLNEQVRRNLLDGIPPNEGDRDDLNHAEQLVLAAYGEARGRVSDLLSAVNSFEPETAKKAEIRRIWERAQSEGLTDSNILIYAAFVRHQNNLLALAVEPQGDVRRAENIHDRIDEDRDSMLDDLKGISSVYKKLGSQGREDFERFVFGADRLAEEATEFRRRAKKIQDIVERPEARALPPPPPLEMPFMAEVSQGVDGERRIAGAVLRRSG